MFCHRTLTITDLVTQYASFSVPHGVHLQQQMFLAGEEKASLLVSPIFLSNPFLSPGAKLRQHFVLYSLCAKKGELTCAKFACLTKTHC